MKSNRIGLKLMATAFSVLLTVAGCSNVGTGRSSQRSDVEVGLTTGGASDQALRSRLFNEGWKFFKGDAPDAQGPAFNDAPWRAVELPHDWSIEGPFNPKWSSGTGYLPAGIGWYRKSFAMPLELKDKRISIRFDGVYKNSEVWCNGHSLGRRPYGYISFEYDLTPYLEFGAGKNVIAVRVDHADFADSRWYPGSGIYRNVFLTVTDGVHVGNYGTFVTTPQVSDEAAVVAIETAVKNDTGRAADITLVSVVQDAHGREAARAEEAGSVAAGGERKFAQTATVKSPELWSIEHPRLYAVLTQIKRGNTVVDAYRTPFGVRTCRFDPNKGFLLNGTSIKMKGVCIHHDAGALGAAVPVKVWERRLRLLQQVGCNALRLSHNPPAPELLDLCDRMGFLVMDEAFDEWSRPKNKWVAGWNKGQPSLEGYAKDFGQWADIDLRDMVLRDRNHPSIVFWSIGNEIDYPNDPYPPNSTELPPIAARLVKVVKVLDQTRPVTAACAATGSNLFCDELDVVGYNYQEDRYTDDHQRHPSRVIYGSENKHTLDAWRAVAENDYNPAQFLWTGIDYLGEACEWPNKANPDGLLDLAGFKKPRFYFRQSLWTDKPMVYLHPTETNVICYTNCDRVELLQDGTSLGEQPLPAAKIITWPVAFTQGTLKAIGKKGGSVVCTFELKEAGEAQKLVIQPDTQTLAADGQDVAHLEVQVTDREGSRVTDAAHLITCTVDGPARILGIESGDNNSTEDYKTNFRKAWQGRVLVYVQSLKRHGEITVSVAAPGLEPAGMKIRVE